MPSDLLYLNFNPTGDLLKATRECEQDVFLEAFGNTREQLTEEYGPYEDNSTYICVANEAGYVVGEVRIIWNGPAGLKTLNDIAGPPWSIDGTRSLAAVGFTPNQMWDVGTLGVRKEHRAGGLVSLALYHGLITAQTVNDSACTITIMDDKIATLLAMVDCVFNTIPGTTSQPYLGSPSSTPLYADRAWDIEHQRKTNPEAYRLMCLGVGLDGISLPPRNSYILPAYTAVKENEAA